MKMIILGLVTLSSISAFASETKTSCSFLQVTSNGSLYEGTPREGEKLIQTLIKKNSKAGFDKVVAVNSHLLPKSDYTQYAQYCVTSKY